MAHQRESQIDKVWKHAVPAYSITYLYHDCLVNSICTCFYRWRLVIHGGVDGFSRISVYLHCSNNNRADTVFHLFQEAVTFYGPPSRIQCDKGGENVDVSMFLLSHPLCGPGRGTMIVEKSFHN